MPSPAGLEGLPRPCPCFLGKKLAMALLAAHCLGFMSVIILLLPRYLVSAYYGGQSTKDGIQNGGCNTILSFINNCKADEKYIPVNYGFLFSADDLWLLWGQVEGCQIWSGLLVSPPSCVRDELVLIQLHPACCSSSLGSTSSFTQDLYV